MKKKFRSFGCFLILAFWFGIASAEEGFHLLATMSGDSVGDEFSIVAGVGDVNGDGYDDVLIGAPGGEYAKLYFGGAPFDTITDLTFVDEKEYTRFGCSVAGRGDVNGDGYPDIIIGASDSWVGPLYPDKSVARAGAAYVYFGGADMDTIPDLELVVGNWDEQVGWYYHFGHSVSFAGDMNNDGYDDIIVGAPNDDYDAHGRTYIYFGGAEMDTIYDVLIEGPDHFDMLGWSVSNAWDVNKDGFDDVIIGAPQSLADNPGKAYLIYGGNEIGFTNAEVFIGDSTMLDYGIVVAGLGDVNGDDYPDVGIMAWDCFRVISGEDENILLEISYGREWFGNFTYITGGDINCEGYNDILIGIAQASELYAGEFRMYLGAINTDTIPDYSIAGKTPHYYFGSTIEFLGDLNNDGKKDIIIGERGQYSQGPNPIGIGKTYIYTYDIENKIKDGINYLNEFWLYQNYPNPFNATTKITYYLPAPGTIRLSVYNVIGQEIDVLINKLQPGGSYTTHWDAGQNPSGIFFYQLIEKSDVYELSLIRKMLLLK